MPYASSIQIVNDANGVAHAFLADNGAILQGQWNAQAQRWDQGQLVPLAFGGEKLQALYLDNLWPTDGGGDAEFNPGIVLAYRVGEGNSAEIYASFGQWGGDGELTWFAPVQLTDDQVDDKAFSLVAAPSSSGGFSLVVQKKQAGTPVNALLDQLASASGDELESQLDAAVSGTNPDSDLYATQFNLALSSPSSTDVVLTSNASTQTTAIMSAAAEALPATTAAAFGGNTQLSREELQAGAMPVAAPATASMRAMQAPSIGMGSSEPSAESSSPQTASGQSSQGWKGSTSFQSSQGGGTLKYGAMPLQNIYRWELNIPANTSLFNNTPQQESEDVESDYYVQSRNSSVSNDLNQIDQQQNEALLSNRSHNSDELSDEDLDDGRNNPEQEVVEQGVFSEIFNVQKLDRDEGGTTVGSNLKLRGAFGIANFGSGGLASVSTSKLILGVGDEDSGSLISKVLTSGWNRNRTLNPTSKGSWNIGLGGGVQSEFQYSNKYVRKPNLTSVTSRESIGIDASFRWYKVSSVAEAVFRVNGALSSGYEWTQDLSSEKLPEWLATIGYIDGILGQLARKTFTGAGGVSRFRNRNTWDNTLSFYNGTRSGSEGTTRNSYISAIVGTLIAITGPAAGRVAANASGATYSKSSGWQFGERLTAAVLFYGISGFEINLANRTSVYPYITGTGANQGTWDDTFFTNFGVAFPLGGMLPLLSYYHTWKRSIGKTTSTAASAKTLGATEAAGDASSSELSSSGSYNSAATGADYPLTYAPAAGSNSYFSAATSGAALGAKASSLQQLTLGTTEIGAINSSTSVVNKFALTLYNQGANLNDGSYTNVAILGATISGSLDSAALASFSVVGGSIVASSFQITKEGTYLALPQSTAMSGPNSGNYDLVLDVFSSGIANPLDKNAGSVGNPFLNLPLITLDSSNSLSPLSTQNIQIVDFVDVPQPSASGSQSAGTSYLPYNPVTDTTSQLPSNNNASYSYSNIPVSLYSASNSSQLIAPINDSATATVHLSNGVIVRIDLNQPLFFVPPTGAELNQPGDYTIQLVLPQAVLGNNGTPTYSVTSQNLGFNNFVEEDQFAAQAGAVNSGVYLAAGISDQLPLYASMGSHAVQNRVAYITQEQNTINGKIVTTSNIVYLNGMERYTLEASPGQYRYASTPAVLPSDLSLENYYINDNNNIDYFFSAASTPTAVTIAGPTSSSSSSIAGDTFVAWVEASKPVIPLGTTEGGTANFQAYMEGLYGAQRINYRINVGGDTGWVAPKISDLYYPKNAVIRHLKAFNVADPSSSGQEQTLLVWSETAFAAIKGEQEALASGSLIPAVIKAGLINSNPKTYQWNDLFTDASGNSTIQQIPWDPTKDVGLAIEEISIGSLPQLVNGIFAETPVVSWSQNVRTPYRQSVLDSSPIVYLQFGELKSGLSDINIGSVDSTSTYTTASTTGLNFAIPGALPASQSTAVQNSDGTGVLSTGTGSSYSQILQFANNIPSSSFSSASASTTIAALTGSIKDTTLTVTALTSGSLDAGDIISGPGIIAGTTISALVSVDAATGLGTYSLNEKQDLASTELEALPAASQLPITIFSGSINGTTLNVTQLAQGNLDLGDVISGEGITPGTTIIAGSFDADSGTGSFTLNNSQSVASSALVAIPGTPTVPYTIEFWAQLPKLPIDSNPNGAGLVAFGQPSTAAIGSYALPDGWLLTSSFVVDKITYNEAAAKGLIDSIPADITSPSTTDFGWGWAMVADGANTTAMEGNSGNNLYSNALNIYNLVNGSTISGVADFLNKYTLNSSDLLGSDGINTVETIAQAPTTELQFSNEIDSTGLANSNLNAIAVDTSSSVLNQGFVSANDANSNQNLLNMFQDLWSFQQKTGEAKVNFSLAPDSPIPPSTEFTGESYAGYELGFSLSRGTAVSVNGNGELVFDIGNGTSLVGVASDPSISSDLRDGQWHYIVASYLPNYASYTVAGSIVQLPTNVGTASIYVDNQLIAVQNNVIDAYQPINLNDQALLLANNAGGAIDQLAFYSSALSVVDRSSPLVTSFFTGSIAGNTLNVASLSSGSLAVGDVITGPGIAAGTFISAIGQVDASTGIGSYILNESQTVSINSQVLEAISSSSKQSISTFSGTITGTTLTINQSDQGSLGIGYAIDGLGITPGTIITGIQTVPNSPVGTSTYTVNISQSVPSSSLVASPSWPAPSAEDALAMLAALGYGIDTKTPLPGITPGAVTSHWNARKVNPNDALLGSYYSVFTPDSTAAGGSWSNASNLNPATQLEATSPSASQPGSMQDDLVIAISASAWNAANWKVNGGSASQSFNPAHDELTGITVILTNDTDKTTATIQLTAEQVLLGSNTLQALQPLATATDFNYTVLTNAPSFNLVIPKDQLPSTGSNKLAAEYNATYTFNFTPKSTSTDLVTSYQVSNAQPVVVNQKGAAAISTITSSTGSATQLSNRQKRDSAIATAAVFEQAPIQLKYIDSGEVFKSSSSTAAANTPAASSPANTFGASQVFGSYVGGNGYTYGWLAIAQPQSTNASSNPAGRVWIQYTGQSKGGTATTNVPDAPTTWLNAIAQSNFTPDSPNLPLLDNAFNPSGTGGLLIEADPTVGWGENFGQTMLVADVDNDGVLDLVIGAPQANGGGLVYIISGKWFENSLTTPDNATILSLANPDNIKDASGKGYVTVLTPSVAANTSTDDITVAGFGSALAFYNNTLWVGAPNYLRQLDPNITTLDPSNISAAFNSLMPIGAVYSYSGTSLSNPILGSGGIAESLDPAGSPTTTYWGSQFGSSIAVNSTTGALAISAPGVYAGMLYSGTNEVQQQTVYGQKNPTSTYGDGALIEFQAPVISAVNNLPSVSIIGGTSKTSTLVDIVDQSQSSAKKNGNGKEESAYMQSLKKLQLDNIADATVYYNQALQVNAVGAVYLINDSADLASISTTISAAAVDGLANGGSTIYGPNSWNVLGGSGFGSSLAFSDLNNKNKNSILAIGANQTGGSGAVYFVDTTSKLPTSILGSNQYLAHLVSGLTLYGAESHDNFGSGLVDLGDTNGDGYNDLLMQAYNASSGAGNGYLLFGSDNLIDTDATNPGTGSVATGSIGEITQANGTPIKASILSVLGYGLSTYTGQGTFGSGDVNGDGLNDVMLGSGPNGSAYLTWGHKYLEAISNLQLDKLASNTGYMLDGLATTTQGSLRSIGDFNGDGYGDFISINPGANLTNVRLELGGNTQEVLADYPYNFYSFTVSNDTQVFAAGDINGDSFFDIGLFIDQDLSSTSQGAGSTTGILYGRASNDLPIGSGFGYLAPVSDSTADLTSQPLLALPGLDLSFGLSDAAPAVINVGNTIYSVVKGDGVTSLWFAQSSDAGSTWSDWTNITAANAGLASGFAPSLTYFDNKLYLGFINENSIPGLSISSWDPTSNNPPAWTSPTELRNGPAGTASFSSRYSPQLIDRGDALGVVWVDSASGTLYGSYSTTPDKSIAFSNLSTPSAWSPLDGGSSPATPALALDGNTIYMAVQGNGDNNIYWSSSNNAGASWNTWQSLPSGMTSTLPPSLAVVNGTLYLSYVGGGNELNITSLVDASSNSWSSQYQIPGQTGNYASLISETVGSSQQLAIYYVSDDSTDRILKAYTSTPNSSSGWTSNIQIDFGDGSGPQTASGPLALTQWKGQTYIAYQGGTKGNPSDLIYLTTITNASSINSGNSWNAQGTFNAETTTGLGLTSDSNGLILSYGTANNPNSLQLKELSPNSLGVWTVTDTYSESLPSTLSNDVAILSLNGSTGPGLIFAGVNTQATGYGVQTSFCNIIESDTSWSTPNQFTQRIESNGIKSFQAITATAAPSLTWLDQDAVLAVNDGGNVNVYAAIPNSLSWQLASSFVAASSEPEISTAPVLATTYSGLALTYGSSEGTITLQRLNLLDAQGNILDGEQAWIGTTLNQANGGLSSNLATVPLSVEGNLLLANVRSDNNEIWLNAVPNLGNPASTTWLNTSVQLGSILSQRAGVDYSIGGLSAGSWSNSAGGGTPNLASFASYGDTLYMAVQGDGANNLWFNISSDNGQAWNGWVELPSSMGTYTAPSIAYYKGMLYLCYVAAGSNDLNITMYDGANNTWNTQYQISGQSATAASMVVEGNNLAIYFTSNDSSDRILKAYTSTSSPSRNDWIETSVFYGDNSFQTASGNLAVTRYNGQTYIAYQGGTAATPSSQIYLTTASDSVANGSSPNWGFASLPSAINPINHGVGLTSNSQGLLLTYTDSSTPDQVSVQISDADVNAWRSLENAAVLSSNVAYTPVITSNAGAPLLIAGVDTNSDIYLQQNQLNASVLTAGQTGSTISAVGDINGDGLDDLVVTANNVAFAPNGGFNSIDTEVVTGVRFVLGAGSAQALINNNSVTASEQSVQIASLYTNPSTSSSNPVAALNGAGSLSLNGLQAGYASQIVSSGAVPLSTSSITSSASTPASLQQLFAGASSKAFDATFSSSSNGVLSLQTLAGYGDLNGDGYIDYLATDGLDDIDTGSTSVDFSVWSIRAAGDVNGNGLDDVLLTLAPKGPSYVAAADGSPTALQSVLVDGALFKVDANNNTFSLANLKNPLNPYNSGEIYDVTSTSSSQYAPLLQNWFDPILNFNPGNVTAISKGTTSNVAGGAKSSAAPVGVVGNSGDLSFVYSGYSKDSGIWMAYQSTPGSWQQFEISQTSTAAYLNAPSATYYGGNLYVAWVDTSSNMHISHTKAYQVSGELVDFETATWTSFAIANQSTDYSPTLIAEEGRLALYFPSDTSKTSDQVVRYMYSSSPDSTMPSWGSVPTASGTTAAPTYSGGSGILSSASNTYFDCSSPISATTYQGRTVLSFVNGTGVTIATAPSADSTSAEYWLTYSTGKINNHLTGASISTDQALLYLTTSITVEEEEDGYETTSSSVYSLQPTSTYDFNSYSLSSAYAGPSGFYANTPVNTILTDGVLQSVWASSSQDVELAALAVTVSSPTQQSLSGYSVDGNIDVNGDGFTDILISDPSDPANAIDNQYVLFGGDYLDIASQVGTAGNDTLIGTPLADVIYTLSGADEVRSNGGADVIYTASGNDQISIKDNAFLRIDAGAGFDQLLLEGNANQAYNFSLNASNPEYFFGSKLRNIELINFQDFGSNIITLDAAAVNAANPDRVLFLVPDAGDSIQLSSEFELNSGFNTSFAGALWYAYTAGTAVPGSSNPTLVYVGVPVGEPETDWLASNVQTVDASVSFAREVTPLAINQSEPSVSEPLVASALPVGSASFGDGLTITAYSTTPDSGFAVFELSRTDDLNRSQLVSYVSSSLNSSAEPGRHYTPVAGLLRLEPGQVSVEIIVPIDAAEISALRKGTLSLKVQELADLGQKEFHVLLQTEVNSEGTRPTLSGLDLQIDPDDSTGKSIAIGLRADINKPAKMASLPAALQLNVVSRVKADDLPSASTVRSQILSIGDGILSNFDLDAENNKQVELELQVNTETAFIRLSAKEGKKSLALNNLNSAASGSVGVDITYRSIDSVLTDPAPKNVTLSDIAIDFNVAANSDGKANVHLELSKIAGDLALEDNNGKPIVNQQMLLYVVDKLGALMPFNFDPTLKVGGRVYDVDEDGVVDSVVYKYIDGLKGDLDGIKNGIIEDPGSIGTTIANAIMKRNSSNSIEVSDLSNTSPVNFLLNARLTGAAITANHLYYVASDPANGPGIADITADLSLLKSQAISLFTTLENRDVMLPSGISFETGIQLGNGKLISIVEVVDASLEDITVPADPRLRILTANALTNSSKSVSFSSSSGVNLSLDLQDTPQGLDALIAQDQAFAPVLNFTAFNSSQVISGSVDISREASYDALSGFYRTVDDKGTVKDSISGALLRTGEQGYATVALSASNRVNALTGLQVGNRQTTSRSFELQETNYLAPFALVNEDIFFAFAAANKDGISHFKMLGENKYGLEDISGGGDRDYDDQVISFNFSKVAAVV